MRKVLKWKPYRPHAVTVMSIEHREKRMSAANWFLSKELDFFTDKVIWSDKKYSVLKQCPNRKYDMCWSPSDPHVLVACKSQSNLKAMC